jgi:L-alanine-DL-glutamate epimerase-like enolase superfamily enzyme
MTGPIVAVDAFPLAIPVESPGPATGWYRRVSKQLLVRVRAADGHEGWGEAFAYGGPVAIADVVRNVLAPVVIGADVAELRATVERMHRASRIAGRGGLAMMALSAVEIALWDLAGKAARLPVTALLGGAARTRLPAYASHAHYEREEDVATAIRQSVDEGFTAIKLHQTEVEAMRAGREAAGPAVRLAIDTNNGWDAGGALQVAREVRDLDLLWLEEPVWPPEDYEALARTRAEGVPIAAGENEYTLTGFRRALELGAVDVLQPSAAKAGGLTTMAAVAGLAVAAGVPVIPHSFYFGPGLAATYQFAATLAGDTLVEYPLGRMEAPLLREPIRADGGYVSVSGAPGLGVEVDVSILDRYGLDARR